MFDRIKSLLAGRDEEAADGNRQVSELHLAEAALMFHVIAADGKVSKSELDRMKSVLCERHGLSDAQYDELLEAAEEADRESVDLYRFTSALTKQFDREQRIAMIERLWEVVFADGELHEFEDNVVWRVAQLLQVESPDRIAMKQRVRARSQDAGAGDGTATGAGETEEG